MNDLTEKLSRIKAECRRAIELGEKATPGPWVVCDDSRRTGPVIRANDVPIAQCYDNPNSGLEPIDDQSSDWNDRHIAHARTFSPAAARALLTAIEALEENAAYAWPSAESEHSKSALQQIADHWPEI